MSKDRYVQIRISKKDKDLIKDFGGNYTEIWKLGYEVFIEKIPSEVQKKADYYQKLSLHCNDILTKCNDVVMTRKSVLDQISEEYLKTGRSLGDPTLEDMNWLTGRITKHNLVTTPEKVLTRCIELKMEGKP